MQAQIVIVLDDNGSLKVATSTKNPFLNLGLLEMAKDVLKEGVKQPEVLIEVPKRVIPR